MIVKPADPAAVIRDPHTKVQLKPGGAEVPDTNFWIRRTLPSGGQDAEVAVLVDGQWHRTMRDGKVEKTDKAKGDFETERRELEPTGLEPVAPLTTRKGR